MRIDDLMHELRIILKLISNEIEKIQHANVTESTHCKTITIVGKLKGKGNKSKV